MFRRLIIILPLIAVIVAIKVPVDNTEDQDPETITININKDNQKINKPIYYESDDSSVDSYLLPPDPHRPTEVLSEVVEAPATYLLPPKPDKDAKFYFLPTLETQKGSQSDWYPLAQTQKPVLFSQPQYDIPIYLDDRNDSESIQKENKLKNFVPIPSLELQPPLENAQDYYSIKVPSEELELPVETINQQFNGAENIQIIPELVQGARIPFEEGPGLALYLTPPKPLVSSFKNPTKLYPKKYNGGFKPIPIPLAQFAEGSLQELPQVKIARPFKSILNNDGEFPVPVDEKKLYNYQQAELKRRLKAEDETLKQPFVVEDEGTKDDSSAEQDASESNQSYFGQNKYSAPLRQATQDAPVSQEIQTQPPPADRTEFRMHGMKGPHSYQFGYDTGKGKNRQFRYEERDNDGHVRGHYGYMDKHGKLRVVNYDAHPEHGFHAEGPVEKV